MSSRKVLPKNEQNPRYVRILYLKEVRKPKPEEEHDEPFSDKKSLAYLSSLIQDERRGSMEKVTATVKPEPLEGFVTSPAIVNRRDRPRSLHLVGNHTMKHQESRPKQNSLAEILGEGVFSSTQQQFSLKKKWRPQLKIRGGLNKQLKQQFEKDFVRFCIDVKPTGRSYPYKCLMPTSKTASDLTYHEQSYPKSLTKSVGIPRQSKAASHSTATTRQEIERYRLRRNIIYRKNFKEIDNFGWSKVAEQEFTLLS